MKTIILILVLSVACLLTACNNQEEKPPVDPDPPSTVTEDSSETLPADTSQDIAEDTTPSVTDTPEVTDEVEPVPEIGHINTIVLDFDSYGPPLLAHDKLIFSTYEQGVPAIHISDLKYTEIAEFIFEGYDVLQAVFPSEGDILCNVITENYNDEGGVTYHAVDVYTDMTLGESRPYAESEFYTVHGVHKIAESGINLIDAETGDILVEGVEGTHTYGFDRRYQHYLMPIDDNRFIYQTTGYEAIPGFGIYDFSTGKATAVDSRDLLPLGIYEGYIYSQHTAWDGFGTEIYKTNIDTLESELAFGLPFELDGNTYVSHVMSPDCEYILMTKDFSYEDENSDRRWQAEFYKVSVADGSVVWQMTLPMEVSVSSSGCFLNEKTFLQPVNERGSSGSFSLSRLLVITVG